MYLSICLPFYLSIHLQTSWQSSLLCGFQAACVWVSVCECVCLCFLGANEIMGWKDTCWQIIWPSVWAATLHGKVSHAINYKRRASWASSAHTLPHLSPLTSSHSRHFVSAAQTCNWRRPHNAGPDMDHFGASQPPVNFNLTRALTPQHADCSDAQKSSSVWAPGIRARLDTWAWEC